MNELSIPFDMTGTRHLYEQIYTYIAEEIRAGRIAAGEKLPSARALAEHLSVSRSTVNVAYEQLLSEGYIESKPCKGYYACHSEELFAWHKGTAGTTAQKTAESRTAVREIQTQDTGSGHSQNIDFSPHAVDMSHFPFEIWRRISRRVLMESNTEMMSLGHPQGDEALRRTIAAYLHQARGVLCDPQQIVVGAGNDYLLMLLHRILGDGISIAMENPTYPKAYQMLASFGYRITTVPVDQAGMRSDRLKTTDCSVAYVMPSHQFPMGMVMPIGRRLELISWAAGEDNRFLIEDDYDSEFRFRGKPVPALQASDSHDKVIYIGTFSKSIAPAIRTSYMVLPWSLLDRYRSSCGTLASTVSRVDQAILTEFIASGAFERYLNKMRKCYREKHEQVLQELKVFEPHFRITGTDAGLHVVMTSGSGIPEQQLIARAEACSVHVYGLSDNNAEASAEQTAPGSILLGFGALSQQQITEGMKKLQQAWL